MEGIPFHDYAPGLKSLEGVGLDGRRFTNGVIKPGKPYPADISEQESITVIDGVLRVTCGETVTILCAGEKIVIPGGQKATFEALGADVSYHCIYGTTIPCMDRAEIRQLLRGKSGKQFAIVLKVDHIMHRKVWGLMAEEHTQPERIRTSEGREIPLSDVARVVLTEY